MAIVIVLACVLVGALELFAMTRFRDLQRANADLRGKLDRALDPKAEGPVKSLTDGLGKLEDAHQGFSERLAATDLTIEQSDKRLRQLNERLTAFENTRPAGLGERVDEAFRRLDEAFRRIDELRESIARITSAEPVQPGPDEAVQSLERSVDQVSAHVVRWIDSEEAMALGFATRPRRVVRGVLSIDASAVSDVLPLLFEDYVRVNGGMICFSRWAGDRLDYYLAFPDTSRLEDACLHTIRSGASSEPTPAARSLDALLKGLRRTRSGFAQMGPLIMAWSHDSLSWGVLGSAAMLGLNTAECVRDPGRVLPTLLRLDHGRWRMAR